MHDLLLRVVGGLSAISGVVNFWFWGFSDF